MAKEIYVFQHAADEGLGIIKPYLKENGFSINTLHLYKGNGFPASLGRSSAIIVMGGPMNVYENEKYPFLKDETVVLKDFINQGKAVLGICLGAQLIAKAMGASVYKAAEKEVGWRKVDITKQGEGDPLFAGVKGALDVFQYHQDTFDLPLGARLLATSKECPNQAFRIRNAYGFQFHFEITLGMLDDWFGGSPRLLLRFLRAYETVEYRWLVQNKVLLENLLKLLGT